MIKSFKAAAAFLATACMVSSAFAATFNLTVNGNTKQGTVPHFWSRCVGTGGAQLCTDANWKAHAKIAVEEAGFQAFRGHRLLSASNPISWSGSGTPSYNWTAFDRIMDFYVDTLKTTPVVELSSMPRDLQSNGEWSPPKNFDVWGQLIKEVVSHCVTRYGREKVRTWMWEVWNEWDYSGFWSGGTEQQYYQLYQKAVENGKSVDSLMMFGGPSSTGSYRLQAFVDFCKSNNVKYDLLSNHCYGGGAGGPNADARAVRNDNRTRAGIIKNQGRKIFNLNTEYSSSYSGQGGNTGANCISMDNHVNAPFVAKCVKLILDDHTAGTYAAPDVLSYWAVSDVFDEGSWYASHSTTLFGQVFGLINQHGIRKATFNAHKLLNMMGTTRLACTGGTGDNDGVDGFATVNANSSEVAVMIYNYYIAIAQTGSDDVNLTVNNLPLPNGPVEVHHYRIDSLHSNPYGVWMRLGKPASTNTSAMDQIRTASNLAEMYTAKTINYTGSAYTESFTLPKQGLSMLLFKSNSVNTAPKKPAAAVKRDCSLNGTVLRVVGAAGKPVHVAIVRLDGKNVKTICVFNGSCDLRTLLPRGIFIVRAQGHDQKFLGKIVVDR